MAPSTAGFVGVCVGVRKGLSSPTCSSCSLRGPTVLWFACCLTGHHPECGRVSLHSQRALAVGGFNISDSDPRQSPPCCPARACLHAHQPLSRVRHGDVGRSDAAAAPPQSLPNFPSLRTHPPSQARRPTLAHPSLVRSRCASVPAVCRGHTCDSAAHSFHCARELVQPPPAFLLHAPQVRPSPPLRSQCDVHPSTTQFHCTPM
jgi:hypothetical protein